VLLPTKRKDIPPERRRQILRAARELFAQSGYHGVTVDAIAQRAGISKGTVYWYFKSKQEIFQLLFDDVASKIFMPFVAVMERDAPAGHKLSEFATMSLDSAAANRDLMHLMWQIAAQPELKGLLSSEYSIWMAPFIDYLARLFEEIGDDDPAGTALLYAVTLDALMFLAVARPTFYQRDTLIASIEHKFLNPRRENDDRRDQRSDGRASAG